MTADPPAVAPQGQDEPQARTRVGDQRRKVAGSERLTKPVRPP